MEDLRPAPQAQLAACELLLSQARSEASAAMLAQREQLGEAAEAERAGLMAEMRALQARLGPSRGGNTWGGAVRTPGNCGWCFLLVTVNC